MMLDAKPLKHLGAAIVHVDRTRHRDGALGQQQAVAFVLRNLEVVGDDVKLLRAIANTGPGIEVFHAAAPSSSKSGAAFGALAAPATGQLGFQHKDRNRAELEERAA